MRSSKLAVRATCTRACSSDNRGVMKRRDKEIRKQVGIPVVVKIPGFCCNVVRAQYTRTTVSVRAGEARTCVYASAWAISHSLCMQSTYIIRNLHFVPGAAFLPAQPGCWVRLSSGCSTEPFATDKVDGTWFRENDQLFEESHISYRMRTQNGQLGYAQCIRDMLDGESPSGECMASVST